MSNVVSNGSDGIGPLACLPDHKDIWVLGSGKDNLSGDQKQ